MKLTIEPTDHIVTLFGDDGQIKARVWQGETDSGIPVHCFVVRLGVEKGRPQSDYEQFERDLTETAPARPDVASIPLRLIL